jgi:ParB family chromosome partitioning protein
LEALLGRVAPSPDRSEQQPGGSDSDLTSPSPSAAASAGPPDHGQRDEADGGATVIRYPTNESATEGAAGTEDPPRLAIERIDSNPFQPRQDFDEAEIGALAESLATHGLLQPVIVRRVDDRYQLVAGERRLRAAAKAGWADVPVHVREADDREVAELAIVENMQRKDLNALEKAASFQRYLEQYGGTQEELAGRLKIDRSTVSNLIRLLELPGSVQDAVRQSKITQGHARALLPLGDEHEQIEFCRRIQDEGLSVRRTEALVQETIREADTDKPLAVIDRDGTRRPRPQSEHIGALEQEFRLSLGTNVRITHSSRGRGKLVIHFTSHEEFDRLRQQLCHPGMPRAEGIVG